MPDATQLDATATSPPLQGGNEPDAALDAIPGEGTVEQGNEQLVATCPEGSELSVEPSAQTPSDASVRMQSCQQCEAGNHCPGGSSPRSPCSVDTWDDDTDPATACRDKTECGRGSYVVSAGTAVADRVCLACEEGSYTSEPNQPGCSAWSECAPGTSVATPGSAQGDQVCAPCPTGMFSSTPNALECRTWTTCQAPARYQTAAPSEDQDRSCGECEAPYVALRDNAIACRLSGTPFELVDGVAALEAEDFHDATASESDDSWSALTVSGISGGVCMEIGPDDGSSWTSEVTASAPRLDYLVQFDEAGAYYVFVRGDAGANSDGLSDSCFVGVDGAVMPVLDFANQGNTWGWLGQRIQVDTAGVHTVNLYAREDGFRVDKLVISVSDVPPTGNGPATQ